MTRYQLGRLIQLGKAGWVDVVEACFNETIGGPVTMARGSDRIEVDNDGSVTFLSDPAGRPVVVGMFDPCSDHPLPPELC